MASGSASPIIRRNGWEADERPEPRSLGLLPSGPDPVGEWLVHRQPPGPYIGRGGGESKLATGVRHAWKAKPAQPSSATNIRRTATALSQCLGSLPRRRKVLTAVKTHNHEEERERNAACFCYCCDDRACGAKSYGIRSGPRPRPSRRTSRGRSAAAPAWAAGASGAASGRPDARHGTARSAARRNGRSASARSAGSDGSSDGAAARRRRAIQLSRP